MVGFAEHVVDRHVYVRSRAPSIALAHYDTSDVVQGRSPVNRNVGARRFEIVVNGGTAFLRFAERDGRLLLIHTEVPPLLRRRGYATQLAHAALEYARGMRLRVVPSCPFVQRYLEGHSEYLDLIDPFWKAPVKPSTTTEGS